VKTSRHVTIDEKEGEVEFPAATAETFASNNSITSNQSIAGLQ